jgi:hypothetical protein
VIPAVVVRPGPSFSVEDVATGWIEGLRANGVHVTEFDTGAATTYHEGALKAMGIDDPEQACLMASANLRQTCFDVMPDLLLVVSSFLIAPAAYDIIRSRGIKVVSNAGGLDPEGCARELHEIATRLGLSPCDRARLKVPAKPPEEAPAARYFA